MQSLLELACFLLRGRERSQRSATGRWQGGGRLHARGLDGRVDGDSRTKRKAHAAEWVGHEPEDRILKARFLHEGQYADQGGPELEDGSINGISWMEAPCTNMGGWNPHPWLHSLSNPR